MTAWLSVLQTLAQLQKTCLKKSCECTARNLSKLFNKASSQAQLHFSRWDVLMPRSSPQVPALDNRTSQHSSAHNSCRCAPIFNRSSTSKREGWSAKLESVGTLANQGANCNSVSKDKTATKIFLATAFVVWQEIMASRTALLSVYKTKALLTELPHNNIAQKRAKNSHSKIAVLRLPGFKAAIICWLSCCEKNATGFPSGANKTPPIPART